MRFLPYDDAMSKTSDSPNGADSTPPGTQLNTRFVPGPMCAALLLWLAQPPLGLWPIALVALAPMISWCEPRWISKRSYLWLYLSGVGYWLITLQGLRHAHPAIYAGWITLALVFGAYFLMFVIAARKLSAWNVPVFLAIPISWVGCECVRNYLFTGISAAMLGHAVADVPWLIQIADFGGTYAVSFVLASSSVAAHELVRHRRLGSLAFAALLIGCTVLYGRYRLDQATAPGSTTFALIQRNEQTDYFMDEKRPLEIFDAYVRQSVQAARSADLDIDVFVWPESMFTADLPLLRPDLDRQDQDFDREKIIAQLAKKEDMSTDVIVDNFRSRIDAFEFRSRRLQELLLDSSERHPDLIVGCSVIRYTPERQIFSGMVHVDDQSRVSDWYGKTHLVLFGERIPILNSIPGIRSWIPDGLQLTIGDGPALMTVGAGDRQSTISPNICIETAVERVTVNQLAQLRKNQRLPDAIVTVTNDGWYGNSSIIDHHRRCAQLVAVGCRRPILSAANNGPTVWIDSFGCVVGEVAQGENGAVIATPRKDDRTSLYLLIRDWPARMMAMIVVFCLIQQYRTCIHQPI